jgi:hypothetical protein
VCLEGDFASILREIAECGVQPDLLGFGEDGKELAVLLTRGSILVKGDALPDDLLLDVTWEAQTAPALWLPKVDVLVAEVLPAGDPRQRWLKFAPRYLGRSLAARRYMRMSGAELQIFEALVESAMVSGILPSEITIRS